MISKYKKKISNSLSKDKDDFKSLGGCFKVPNQLRNKSWKEVREKTKEIVARKIALEGLE